MNYQQIFSQYSLAWALAGLLLLGFSWHAAATGRKKRHQWLMICLVIGAWVFVLAYVMLRFHLAQQPTEKVLAYIPWLIVHGSIGLFTIFGVTCLMCARGWQKFNPGKRPLHLNYYHRVYGRCLVVLWLFTHLGGVANYWLLNGAP